MRQYLNFINQNFGNKHKAIKEKIKYKGYYWKEKRYKKSVETIETT